MSRRQAHCYFRLSGSIAGWQAPPPLDLRDWKGEFRRELCNQYPKCWRVDR